MVMWTLERSPDVWVHHEHSRSVAFRDFRLRPTPIIERLIQRAPAPVVAFKPICDSHLTRRYLERHPGARAVWVYRRFPDVANSLVRAFGGHEKDILRWIVRGDWDWLDWRGEGLSSEAVELVRGCFHESMKDEEAASIVWYLRTRFYLDLGLDRDDRVLLVRYEDLVADPNASFERVFAFAGLPFDASYASHVFATSIGKHRYPDVADGIRRACEEVQERMDAAYAKQASARVVRPIA